MANFLLRFEKNFSSYWFSIGYRYTSYPTYTVTEERVYFVCPENFSFTENRINMNFPSHCIFLVFVNINYILVCQDICPVFKDFFQVSLSRVRTVLETQLSFNGARFVIGTQAYLSTAPPRDVHPTIHF